MDIDFQILIGKHLVYVIIKKCNCAILAGVHTCATVVRRLLLKWSAQRPILFMTFVIIGTVTLLPFVTAVTLLPVASLFTYTGILASQGFVYLAYNILIQGILFSIIIMTLFIISFIVITGASVLHYYRAFKNTVS